MGKKELIKHRNSENSLNPGIPIKEKSSQNNQTSRNGHSSKKISTTQRKTLWLLKLGFSPDEASILSMKPKSFLRTLLNESEKRTKQSPEIKTISKVNSKKIKVPLKKKITSEDKSKRTKQRPEITSEDNSKRMKLLLDIKRQEHKDNKIQALKRKPVSLKQFNIGVSVGSKTTSEDNSKRKKLSLDVKREEHKDNKIQALKREPVSLKQFNIGVSVGVLHAKYPKKVLSTEEMNVIKEALLNLIAEEQDDSYNPSFQSVRQRPGYLLFICQDDLTAKWLKSKQEELKVREGINIKMVTGKEIPRTPVALAFFPDSSDYTNQKILHLVQKQNKGLKASEWRVVRRDNKGKCAVLTLSVDSATTEKLNKNETVRINYKFGKVKLRFRNKIKNLGGTLRNVKTERTTTEDESDSDEHSS